MLNLFFFSFVFLFGLIVGSFLNCVIYRLEVGESFLKGRSFCPHCKKELAWRDLIPVFSFIWLRSKCRYCQEKISWQYPAVELATGIIFSLIALASFGSSVLNYFTLIYYWVIAAFLIIIFIYDLRHYIIPDKIIYSAIIVSVIWRAANLFSNLYTGQEFFEIMCAAIIPATFFLSIVLLSGGKWMGVGDIKLAFLMGLILGWPGVLIALSLAFYSGAIVGLGLMAFGKKKFKSEVPFAPFLVAGTFAALFWGNELINWYQELFLV